MAFIEIAAVDKSFGAFKALRSIDLNVEAQEFVTFLGPSGCGKTTLLRSLAGFLQIDAGSIRVNGRELSSATDTVPPEHRRMGMVFQNYAIWPHMSVFENVAFGLRVKKLNHSEVEEKVARVLDAVGLKGFEKRHPGQLSGGQQQRVALARSLVVEPDILLLDEPLSNLDAKLRDRMRTELKDLQRRTGITFIYVTHDQAEAMALSDRIVVFNKGCVQQVGTPREVYERPTNLFVADFMGLVNKIPATLVSREADHVVVDVAGQRVRAKGAANLTGSVVLAIRPEAISLGRNDAGPGDSLLTGKTVDSVFLGNIVDLQIDIGQGIILRVQGDRRQGIEPGTELKLNIPIDECSAIAADPTQQGDRP